jgi:quinohemoprotein ethanol dehydrogenase
MMRGLAIAGVALAVLAGCSPAGGRKGADRLDDARLLAAATESQNWLTHGGTYLEQRYSPLDAVNDGNVSGLKLAWFHDFDTNRGQEATPIVVDGVMYTTSAWSKVYALNAATGERLWSYDPEVPGERGFSACCDVVNRGVAVYDGKVFFGTLDGRLIALNARTGKPVWSMVTVDQSQPYTITGAPRIVKGKVLIGNGGAEYGVRGYVSAYDADDGKLAWRFYTVPGQPGGLPDGAASDEILKKASDTWAGEWWKLGGGGTVWDAIVYDPEFESVYIGVGNGSPWNHRQRSEGKGDNLFLSSIVALNAETGEYKWHYQSTPAETWDFTATQPIILADLPIGGETRKVLMQAPKNGFFYVLDRRDGKLISAKNFVPTTWASHVDPKTGRPVETPNARFDVGEQMTAPSALGAHNWHPMAFSPKTRLVYLPAQEVPFLYADDQAYKPRPGAWNIAVASIKNMPPEDPAQFKAIRALLKGQLVAWDPVAQREVWRAQYDGPWNGGALATGGNLVFQGNARGEFQAFRADNGRKLWSFDAQTGVIAGPVTYSVNGEQYVAVSAGYGGAYPLSSAYVDNPRPMPNGRMLVFKLNGQAQLPPKPAVTLAPANPPATVFPAALVQQGLAAYEGNCGVCHGPAGRSSGVLPDLRRSGALGDADTWREVVIGGALKERGMASFAKYLTEQESEAIRAYIGEHARNLQKAERAAAPDPTTSG